MRDIKFRAWAPDLTSKKRMLYDGFAVDAKTGKGIWLGLDTYPFDESDVVMQYTGLTDKNGMEIYEGDIIKAEWETGKFAIDAVTWNEDVAAFSIGLTKKIPYPVTFEVIGNIYENPELLT